MTSLFGDAEVSNHRPRGAIDPDRYATRRLGEIDVYLSRAAIGAMWREGRKYARPTDPVESAFLCMGRRGEDAEGAYAILEAFPFVASGGPVTVKLPIGDKRRARGEHPALDVVGWAHTHPGMPIFLSSEDVATCAQYATDAVNIVFDPLRDRIGLAVGAKMQIVGALRRVLGQTLPVTKVEATRPKSGAATCAPASPPVVVRKPRRRGPKVATGILLAVALVSVRCGDWASTSIADVELATGEQVP